MAIQENDDIFGDEQPSQVLQDNAQISETSIDVSLELDIFLVLVFLQGIVYAFLKIFSHG